MSGQAPAQRPLQAVVPAQGTAGTPQDEAVGTAPFDGTVSSVTIIPEAAVAANGTNFRTFRLVNKGQTGTGTTVIASLATSATSLVAFDEIALPLSGTAANLVVTAGDVLAADETVAASGVAHAGYTIKVNIDRS